MFRRFNLSHGLRYFSKATDGKKESVNDFKLLDQKLTELSEINFIRTLRGKYNSVINEVSNQNSAIIKEIKTKKQKIDEKRDEIFDEMGKIAKTALKPASDIKEKLQPHVRILKETEIAKNITEVASGVDKGIREQTNYYQYGGIKPKADRINLEEHYLSYKSTYPENKNAGNNLVKFKNSKGRSIIDFFQRNMKSLMPSISYPRSNNILLHFLRSTSSRIFDSFTSLFEENEMAKTTKYIKVLQPSFSIIEFQKKCREYIIPNFVEALISADTFTLKGLCTDSCFTVINSSITTDVKSGFTFSGKVLDLRDVEIVAAKLIDDVPTLIFTFTTNQLSYVKDISGCIIQGSDTIPEFISYILAMSLKDESWKISEVAIRGKNMNW